MTACPIYAGHRSTPDPDAPPQPVDDRRAGLAFAHRVERLFSNAGWGMRLAALEELWRIHGAAALEPLAAVRLPVDVALALMVLSPRAPDRPRMHLSPLVDRLGSQAVEVITALVALARRNGVPDPTALVRLADRCVGARGAVMQALAERPDAPEKRLLRWLPTADRALLQALSAWLIAHGTASALGPLRLVRASACLSPEAGEALSTAEAAIRVRTYRASAGRLACVAPKIGRATFRYERHPRPLKRSVRRA